MWQRGWWEGIGENLGSKLTELSTGPRTAGETGLPQVGLSNIQ